MVLSETIQYITILGITLIFSAFSMTIEREGLRMALKIVAVLSWFVMSLSTFFFFGTTATLAIPLTVMFLGIGLVFAFTTITEWTAEKKDKIWSFGEE